MTTKLTTYEDWAHHDYTAQLKVVDVKVGLKDVFWADNDVRIGEFITGDDGFWVFFPEDGPIGYWSAHYLYAIAQTLTKLNLRWQNDIEEYFGRERSGLQTEEAGRDSTQDSPSKARGSGSDF
jgi:hypothetical protein